MEVQGIKILRISDLRRFFDLTDFWRQKEIFVKQVGDSEKSYFFNSGFEKCIFDLLKGWLISDLGVNSIYKGDGIFIVNVCGQDVRISLGRIALEYEKYRGTMRKKDLDGLTLLYLLLGANVNEDIELQYDIFAALKTGNYVGDFIPCYDNQLFESSSVPQYPISRRIIANMKTNDLISVNNGIQRINLLPGDCVVGIFDVNDKCLRLLPNALSNMQYGISMKMRLNRHSKRPYLEIHTHVGVESLEDVSSIAFENGGTPVYSTLNGEMHCPQECFTLVNEYNVFRKNFSEKMLAFEILPEGGYVFYTANLIVH